ncbi:uncharacterized protein MELLADRAFT_117398 [Melampsora larici-populina 98AG31]|uniref:Secreted protein n=1 Tax=Melampsora larici-populina (strain 98AG31 / pathotype 3-4-7) TaxID=747676 RepID=F4RWQ4_MELLP|nr:uncharacterized protein MELLADRAFT_117398 [Melampsora larici-populina 98AG31]EGG03070.1 secreted protein [Melampsora larici-populina 98AG31]
MHSLHILVFFPTVTFAQLQFISRDPIVNGNITTIPTCAVTCSLQVASRTRCSDPSDSSCSCTDPVFRKEVLACYHRQCDEVNLELSIKFANDTCAKASQSNLNDTIVSNTSSTDNSTTYSPTNSVNISDPLSVGNVTGNLTGVKNGDLVSNFSVSNTYTQPISDSSRLNDSTITSASSSTTLKTYTSSTLMFSSILCFTMFLYNTYI